MDKQFLASFTSDLTPSSIRFSSEKGSGTLDMSKFVEITDKRGPMLAFGNYDAASAIAKEFRNEEMIEVWAGTRLFTPLLEARKKVSLLWKDIFGSSSNDICQHLFLDEAIITKIDKAYKSDLSTEEIFHNGKEVDALKEFENNLDFQYITIMNLLQIYCLMEVGVPFQEALKNENVKSNRIYTTKGVKEEIMSRTKSYLSKLGTTLTHSRADLLLLQEVIFTIFGGFTVITREDFFACFPHVVLEKYLGMLPDKSLNDADKSPMLSYIKRLSEKCPQLFYNNYYDILFVKRNLFALAPQFASYWLIILNYLSNYAPSAVFKYLVNRLGEQSTIEQDETRRDSTTILILDFLSQIMMRQGRDFVLTNTGAFDKIDANQFKSISVQKQFYKVQNEFENAISGLKTSPISIYMKTLEKTSHNNIIFIVDFNGTKKKMSMLDSCGYTDMLLLIEEKFSINRNEVLINIFDEDCRDYVELDPSEHDFKNMSQPIKIKMTERVEKQDFTESSVISSIDQYKITRQLKSDKTQTVDLISMTFLAEEKQLNKEVRKIAIKYLNFKGSKAEGNLSENILTLKRVKEFEKANLVPICDILKPEAINKQKVKKVHHLAFTLPYYSHGSVATLLKEKVSLNTRMILSLIKYSLEGFNTLEEARFEYGNIKEENILVEQLDLSSGTIRIRITGMFIIFF